MARAVSRRPLVAESRVRARFNPCGICSGQSDTGTDFSQSIFFPFPLSESFHRGSPCLYITREMNNRPVGGCSSETPFHPHRHEQKHEQGVATCKTKTPLDCSRRHP
jgi:hypothetical protein